MVAIMSPNKAAKTAKRAATSATKSVPRSSPVQIAKANGRQGVQAWLDHVTPEQHDEIRRIKDFGSAAVFFGLCLTGLVWLTAFAVRCGLL